MGFIQAVLGGVFTVLGAGSLFFIAYKALMIGNDVAEMKELLRNMQRGGGNAAPNYPTPLEQYDSAELPNLSAMASASSDSSVMASRTERVLPPPISRRLDAERGVRRESEDESRVRY